MNAVALFVAVFLACTVEAVEAATIVLAAGTARDWRSATTGMVAALATLALLVAALGPALSFVPLRALRLATSRRFGSVPDWYGFSLSFKGVLLEGLEVVFIVLTFGANARNVPLAVAAAVAAAVIVAAVGAAVRGPLSRVPENALKLAVGVMLTAFGTFWGAEGAGARWPGSDAALLALVPAIALFALALIALARRMPGHRADAPAPSLPAQARGL